MNPKNVVILGSTGSIGKNTLKVIEDFPDRFRVVGLTAFRNVGLLEEQIRRFSPSHVAVGDNGAMADLQRRLGARAPKVLSAQHDLSELVSRPDVDVVVIGMSGSAALEPFLSAARAGKRIAPANKEALVVAGDILMAEVRANGAKIIPVDSEQSAIFQCLEGHARKDLKKVTLTASGGALHKVPRSRFDRLGVSRILKHPRWKMGRKITVDSATLMNKGFEVIEAKRLFDLEVSQIEVVIHPEAVIHSMVSFRDGSIIAQLGVTDMRIPIQYALTYPQRWETGLRDMDFVQLKQLTFAKPDLKKFPALALCMEVARKGGILPSVLNAADEEAVEAFLKKEIRFTKIVKVVEDVVARARNKKDPDLKDILAADAWAREEAKSVISRCSTKGAA